MFVTACASQPVLGVFDIGSVSVDDTTLRVAIAASDEERAQGLRGVDTLPDGVDGMLFVFGEERPASFGMEDTIIPLDIWWFDGDGVLLGSTDLEPCPGPPCPVYASPGGVAWALETPAGSQQFEPGALLVPPDRNG